MAPTETTAIIIVSLLAAFADGDKHERERVEIKRIAEGLAGEDGLHLPTLYQDVLLKRITLDSAVAELTSMESRQLAYEMAVCVCDADGVQSDAERHFLDTLRTALGMATPAAAEFARTADALAAAPLGGTAPAPATATAVVDEAELDRGHIKDFLATAGVGMSSQFLEQAGRKLLGGLLGKIGGGLGRGLGNQAVSSGMSFASTYALGQVAKHYYAGGRTLSTQMLKDSYASVIQEGRQLQSQYLPAIQEKARTLDAGKILAMVRGA